MLEMLSPRPSTQSCSTTSWHESIRLFLSRRQNHSSAFLTLPDLVTYLCTASDEYFKNGSVNDEWWVYFDIQYDELRYIIFSFIQHKQVSLSDHVTVQCFQGQWQSSWCCYRRYDNLLLCNVFQNCPQLIYSGIYVSKIIKIGWFLLRYSKVKLWTFFETHCRKYH